MEHLDNSDKFEAWINKLVSRNWVVYCKPPFGDAEEVVRYIGRYTHRVAISNTRIVKVQDGVVSFKYKDYKANRKTWKVMHLDALEFIRRFLLHVLPAGFHKIRHFGFLANGRRKSFIARIKQLLQLPDDDMHKINAEKWRASCPKCKNGSLVPRMIVTRFARIMTSVTALLNVKCVTYSFDTS